MNKKQYPQIRHIVSLNDRTDEYYYDSESFDFRECLILALASNPNMVISLPTYIGMTADKNTNATLNAENIIIQADTIIKMLNKMEGK